MHRERGLAHRHYVLRPWQVRLLSVVVSWPALVFYVVAVVTWGWMAGQAARVPALQQQVTHLTKDAERLDALTAQLEELRSRYEQVQKMLSAAGTTRAAPPDSASRTSADSTRATRGVGGR
jgi:biopolymer transport protein ExbB/TolQ